MNKKAGTLLILILIAFFVFAGVRYTLYRTEYAVSDAAFIRSDTLSILSFKVGGKVVELFKKENEPVKKGEVLAKIDPVDFEVAKERALKELEALEKETEALKLKKKRLKKTLSLNAKLSEIDVEAIKKDIQASLFSVKSLQTKLQKIKKDEKRYKNLLEKKLISLSDYENLSVKRKSLQDEIEALKKGVEAKRASLQKAKEAYEISVLNMKRIEELEKNIESLEEKKEALKKGILEIENKISYSVLYAPFDGIIAKKFIARDRVVKKGSPVYALVDPKSLYCEVLLSEKKLHGVKVGNRVKITVDALKDKETEGVVESIAPTSASTFSLVPRDIASGEFTKLDQRFKVRIALKDKSSLRVGMSAEVAIERK